MYPGRAREKEPIPMFSRMKPSIIRKTNLVWFVVVLLVAGVPAAMGTAVVSAYGTLPDGREMKKYTLTSARGIQVSLLDYGATLASVVTPDRNGVMADITLGYDEPEGWLTDPSHFGVTVGRFANRIADGKFILDGKSYTLATNNSPGGIPCHLHGGVVGFDRRLWSGRLVQKTGADGVEFEYVSADGEEGYPGELSTKVTYWLDEAGDLTIEYHATTNRTTIVNLTNHVYWNLTGSPVHPILDHQLQLESDLMLPVNAGLIPTGERAHVKDTPFDFTKLRSVGEMIEEDHEQLRLGNGYDHCWIIREGEGVRLAAQLYEPQSGRVVELFTDQPGVQFYSGNFLKGVSRGKDGVVYQFRTGLCLEPEAFPDSPNQPTFPSTVLQPGEEYQRTILWRFTTR